MGLEGQRIDLSRRETDEKRLLGHGGIALLSFTAILVLIPSTAIAQLKSNTA